MIPSWPRTPEQWRVMRNVLIYLALAVLLLWAARGHCAPRYVLPFPARVATLRIDSLARFVGLTEATGHNDGAWVAEVLRHVGITFPAPYCAAGTVTGFDLVRGAFPLPIARSPLALGIWNDARRRGRLAGVNTVKRGDCVAWGHAGTSAGHIAAVVTQVRWPFAQDIEFNTSSGSRGSQRDGGGCYRRVRRVDENLGTLQLKGFVGFE